jgi:hypothetical protein
MSCPYANILGIPNKGVHSTRIVGFALYDILATIIAAYITTFFIHISYLTSLLAWFIIGELLHYIFGVQTAFLEKLGISTICKASQVPIGLSISRQHVVWS